MAGHRFPVVRDYEFLGELGRGSLGTTYRVLCRRTKDVRALKLVANPGDEQRLRLKRDVRALARLDHPNLARCHELGEDRGNVFVVSELVEGTDLAAALDAPAQSQAEQVKRTVFLLGQVLKGLGHLHGEGLVHRGVKPSNVLVNRDGRVKLADATLTVERTLAELETLPGEAVERAGSHAPEQLTARPADARLDLYAVGLLLLDALDGRPSDRPLLERLRARARGERPVLRTGHRRVDRAFGPVVERLLSPSPEGRYGSAAEALARLRDAWDDFRRGTAEMAAPSSGDTLPIPNRAASRGPAPLPAVSDDDPLERTNPMNVIPSLSEPAHEGGRAARPASEFSSRPQPVEPPALPAEATSGEPAPVSDAAVAAILRAPSSDPAPVLEAALVGRDRELQRLERSFEQALAGRGRLVAVAGESGIGKSSLLREFGARARLLGARVVAGRADERLESRRFAIASLLDSMARELARLEPEERLRFLPDDVEALRDVSLGFRELIPRSVERGDVADDAEQRTFLVQAATVEVLRSLATRSPLVVLLEDVHAAGDQTVLVLAHLVRELAGRPGGTEAQARVLPVVTYRPDEVGPDHPLARMLAELGEEGLLERIDLTRLGSSDTARLAATMAGLDETPEALLDYLSAETEGNPLFLVETMKLLGEEGVLAASEGRTRFDPRRLDRLRSGAAGGGGRPVAAGIVDVVRRRLSKLSAGALEVLELASMAGPDVPFGLLLLATGSREEEVLDAVVELLRARILIEPADRLGTYRLDHEKTRGIVLASMKPGTRRTQAGRLARAIEQRSGPRRLERAVELAALFEEAQDADRRVEYLLPAAETLARDGELGPALQRCDQLLELLGDGRRPPLELEARKLRARLLLLEGRLEEAAREYGETRDRAVGARSPAAEVEAWNGLSETAWRTGDLEGSRRLAEGALERARAEGLRPGEATALENLGVVLRRTYDVKAASRHLREALSIRRALGDEAGEARVLSSLGLLFRNQDNYALASTHFQEAREIHARRRDRLGSAVSLSALASIHTRLNEFDRATALYEEAMAIDAAMGNRRGVALCREGLGYVALSQGDYERARGSFSRALEVFRRIGDRHNAAYSLINLGHTEFRSGRNAEAVRFYREAVALLQEIGNRVTESEARSGLSLALGAMGEREAAVTEAHAAVEMAREKGAREKEAWARHTLSRVSGSRSEAERALQLAESVGSDNLMFMIHHQLAVLHLERGEREAAREHFQHAFTLIDAIAERTGHAKEMFLSKPPVVAVFQDSRRL